jgi:glycosyltransferase involved in cell wall biosynthesis
MTINVLAVVPALYDTSPGQRFRIEQWEPYLRSSGIEITYSPFETDELRQILYSPGHAARKVGAVLSGLNRRRSELAQAGDFDLVYVFREAALLGPAFFERRIAASGVPMVFDFDDAVFVAYRSPSNGYLSYLKFPSKTETIVRLSRHVMAGNAYLADYASKFNKNVTIVPTTIDTDVYRETIDYSDRETPVIGWSGSFSTIQHLDTVRSVFQRLAERHRFKLRVIGTDNYSIAGVETEAVKWNAATEVEDLRKIDIGIMPLPDDKWSKGKCGLKALQYMALGIPTVCSPVGVNTEIIQDNENGLIADNIDEWIEKLSQLIIDSSLRARLGTAGRDTVINDYSAHVQAPRVADLFLKAVGNGKLSQNGKP